MRSALDVANYFVEYSDYTKTHLQIQKLTYISHGYMLAIHRKPLIVDDVEAWDHGPVIPIIWRTFKKWGMSPIGRVMYSPSPFTDQQRKVMDEVFAYYGRYCGYYLSQITHDDGDLITPWKQCYEPGKNMVIDDDVTEKYYRVLAGITNA